MLLHADLWAPVAGCFPITMCCSPLSVNHICPENSLFCPEDLPKTWFFLPINKDTREFIILRLIGQDLTAYLVPMKPPPTPKATISTPPTYDVTSQSSQFLGVLYLALTGLIDSALPVVGPWAVAGKAISYLVKLGSII
ncbi:hypothetical protein DSO57_1013338 [Entomophthora muscae]|uniref:Uncharacterized protein n=1 Tax=Entomophthora muscae TaxID=34485 RepID=A0ACC2URL0_9FUNG|nr:hypothetical protein DSO57_1013338 [Entomophthora muscae]